MSGSVKDKLNGLKKNLEKEGGAKPKLTVAGKTKGEAADKEQPKEAAHKKVVKPKKPVVPITKSKEQLDKEFKESVEAAEKKTGEAISAITKVTGEPVRIRNLNYAN